MSDDSIATLPDPSGFSPDPLTGLIRDGARKLIGHAVAKMVKDRGALARVVDDGAIENVYRIQIMNRTESAQTYRVSASGIAGLTVSAPPVSVGPAEATSLVVNLRLSDADAQALRGLSTPVVFELTALDEVHTGAAGPAGVQREKSIFFVPR